MVWINPDSKVRGANVGPTWGRQDPGGPHVGHMNLATGEFLYLLCLDFYSVYCVTIALFTKSNP